MAVNSKSLSAIEHVLMDNADISALYESRGVSREELREVFRLAGVSLRPACTCLPAGPALDHSDDCAFERWRKQR
jgi:hypothetical protein